MLALGSKAAMVVKSGGGLGGLAKGAGLLAVGGRSLLPSLLSTIMTPSHIHDTAAVPAYGVATRFVQRCQV